MEKIFSGSQVLEGITDVEITSTVSKKERKAFKKFFSTIKKKKYKEIATPYLASKPDRYLGTLIFLTNKLRDDKNSIPLQEQERIFQMLVLCSGRPKLILKKHTDDSYSSVKWQFKNFEKKLRRFYTEWDRFVSEINLCQKYIFRGTRDLDRTPASDRLSIVEKSKLEDTLNGIYRAYYYELQAVGLTGLKKMPVIDLQLMHNCYEKEWLLPLSHIILIRDAQNQMMGMQKYKKETLLNGSAKVLNLDGLSMGQRYTCSTLTYRYALIIQASLAHALKGKCKSDCKSAFRKFFCKDYEQSTKPIHPAEIVKPTVFQRFTQMIPKPAYIAERAMQKQLRKIEELSPSPFSVPGCRINIFALRIAAKLELNVDQFQKLTRELPRYFWTRITFENWVKQLNIFDESIEGDTIKRLGDILNPIRTLLNPNEYFSEKRSERELSDSLLKAARTFDKSFIPSSDEQNLWNVFHRIIYFRDLTCPALLLSKTVRIEDCSEELLFGILNYIVNNLDKNLAPYQKKKYIRKILNVSKLSIIQKYTLSEVRLDPKFGEPLCAIMQQLADVKKIEDLTWEKAVKFWSRPEFSLAEPDSNLVKNLITRATKESSSICQQILYTMSDEVKTYICLIAYTKLAKRSIALIKEEIIKTLFEKSFQFVDSSVSGTAVEGGESL